MSGNPRCVLDQHAYVLGDACVIDFGGRDVVLNGTLTTGSGSVTISSGSFTVGPTGFIDGRGNSSASDNGGTVSIQTMGNMTVDASGDNRGRIGVSANDQAGAIEINAGGAVTIAGRLDAAQLTSNGSGGTITIQAGETFTSLFGSVILCTGGTLGAGGGTVNVNATGSIVLGDVLDVSGSGGGMVSLTAGTEVTVQRIMANGVGDGSAGGSITITAGTTAQVLELLALQGSFSSSGTGAGGGGTACIEADGGDVLVAADINAAGASPDGGGGEIDLTAEGAVTIQSGTLDVSGNSAGTVSLTAGTEATAQQIAANGTGDGGSGGSINLTAGTTAKILQAMELQGSFSSTGAGAGGGGTACIEADGGDVLVAADIDAGGASPDGGGGEIDLTAEGAITIQSGTLDVSGNSAGTVTLDAGTEATLQQIAANGIGDAGAGGSINVTAGTTAQLLGLMALQGASSSTGANAGDGGTICIEADYGDVLVAADITAEGASPDGCGGDVDLTAQSAINIQSGTLDVSGPGAQGAGGQITMQAGQSMTLSGSIDGSGGSGGGVFNLDAGSGITFNGPVDLDATAAGGLGGSVTAQAGERGIGTFIVNDTVDVSGGACARGGSCGAGGIARLVGCDLTIAAGAKIKAGGPTGGENDLTAREQLMIKGTVSAAKTILAGTDGRNAFQFPARKPPTVLAGSVTPAAVLSGRDTCTAANQVSCLIPCPTCGDGIVEFPETCDDGPVGATKSCDGCSPFCQIENCDDGLVCTVDTCDPVLGCRSIPVSTPCTEPSPPTPTAAAPPPPTLTPGAASTSTPTTTAAATSGPSPSATRTPVPTNTATSTATSSPTASPSPTPPVPGDANCDGGVTAADVLAVVQRLAETGLPPCGADSNRDGAITVADVEATINKVFGD